MTYPPTPNPDGSYPPPPDPPVQPYQQQNPYELPPSYAPQNPYAQAPNPYAQQQPYDQGYPGSPYAYSPYSAVRRPTEGLAIAALVVSCVSILGLCAYGVGGVLGIVGAVLGHVARRRIKQSGAGGAGMALAGIIVGWIVAAISVLGIAALVVIYVNNMNDLGGSSTF